MLVREVVLTVSFVRLRNWSEQNSLQNWQGYRTKHSQGEREEGD